MFDVSCSKTVDILCLLSWAGFCFDMLTMLVECSLTSCLALSPLFDEGKKELYFQQCFIIEKKLGAGSFGDVS